MIRRVGFAVLTVALLVSACGRQISPNPPGLLGPSTGFMQLTFAVNGALNFTQYSYVVVFNTDGNPNSATGVGGTPLANATQTNYQNFSCAIVVTNVNGNPTPYVYQYVPLNGNPNIAPSFELVPSVSGQILQNISSGTTQFQVTFLRSLCAYFATGATPVPTATATATTSPTASPTGSPTASPTASPTGAPGLGSTWYFNAFTINGNVGAGGTAVTQQTILDSMGTGGATDTSWVSPPVSVLATNFTLPPVLARTPINPISDPAAQIYSITIVNTP